MARRRSSLEARPPKRRGQTTAQPKTAVASDFPIIAIGASAGGLEPLGAFLGAMPITSGLAFVVIQHLDPHVRSALPELLARHTAMRVQQAEHGVELKANEVYVIAPGTYLTLASGKLNLAPAPPGVWRPHADRCVLALARRRSRQSRDRHHHVGHW